LSQLLISFRSEVASKHDDVLLGVRFSAVLLVIFGCATALIAVFLVIALCIFIAGHSDLTAIALFVLGAGSATTISLLCIRAAGALHNARRWGAIVAIACGIVLVTFGTLTVIDLYHPARQSADEYFLFPIAPICIAVGAWWCIYLSLPHVRSTLKGSN